MSLSVGLQSGLLLTQTPQIGPSLMADQYARITGRVLNSREISGTTAATPDRPSRPYSFTVVDVLVGDMGVTGVTLGDGVDVPVKGTTVDYLARVSNGKRDPRIQALSDFPVLADSFVS